jgi:hypothetical protein
MLYLLYKFIRKRRPDIDLDLDLRTIIRIKQASAIAQRTFLLDPPPHPPSRLTLTSPA